MQVQSDMDVIDIQIQVRAVLFQCDHMCTHLKIFELFVSNHFLSHSREHERISNCYKLQSQIVIELEPVIVFPIFHEEIA